MLGLISAFTAVVFIKGVFGGSMIEKCAIGGQGIYEAQLVGFDVERFGEFPEQTVTENDYDYDYGVTDSTLNVVTSRAMVPIVIPLKYPVTVATVVWYNKFDPPECIQCFKSVSIFFVVSDEVVYVNPEGTTVTVSPDDAANLETSSTGAPVLYAKIWYGVPAHLWYELPKPLEEVTAIIIKPVEVEEPDKGLIIQPLSVYGCTEPTTTTPKTTTPTTTTTTSSTPLGCPDGFVQIPDAAADKCYKLVLNDSSPTPLYINSTFVKMHEASVECALQKGFIARPADLAQLNAIKEWLNTNYGQLFADNSPNGVWMGYMRDAIPVGELNYDTQVRPERINPDNYYDMYIDPPRVGMNPALWRNSSNPRQDQPNDIGTKDIDRDVFDEMCVAMKKVSHPRIIGLDDYDCADGTLHATFCEAGVVELMSD